MKGEMQTTGLGKKGDEHLQDANLMPPCALLRGMAMPLPMY
jgi:hypothetical protein